MVRRLGFWLERSNHRSRYFIRFRGQPGSCSFKSSSVMKNLWLFATVIVSCRLPLSTTLHSTSNLKKPCLRPL